MKKYYTLIVLLFSLIGAAQTDVSFKKMVNSEMKSAFKQMNLTVNPDTQNYDITYHQLKFTVDPAVYYIAGEVTTTYTALADMNTIYFDLDSSLPVSSVTQNGTNLSFTQNTNNELVITLASTQTAGTSRSVVITYAGAPANSGFGSFTTQVRSNGSNTLYTLSEPFGARDWWPCKQDLNDKVNSIDVYITAPQQYIAVSNGVETTTPVVTGTTKTTHFHHGYPIPAYLICMAVTDYTVYNQTAGVAPNTYPIINYIYPENFNTTLQTQLNQTPLLLNLYSNMFELYPFHNEKYGHAQFGWGGGMEHTTVSFMVYFQRQLIAHEMAHQWFGDKITCGTWKDIWLNESFATYVASMVYENFDGQTAFINDKLNMVNYITSQPDGAVYLSDAEALDVNRIFDGRLSYNKGAMVLNMLRLKMGDAMFFQAMKEYLADPALAYGYAVTTNLQSHLESVYGSSLQEFFNDWIYNQGYPTYSITAQNFGAGQAQVTINQTQSDPSVSFFKLPVPIRFLGAGGATYDIVLNNTVNGEQFVVSVPFVITGIQYDPKSDIISANNTAELATNSFNINNLVEMYPNPTNDKLTLQMPNDYLLNKITVFNNLGQKVLESQTLNFSISNLSNGIYSVDVETSNGNYHKKIIKN